MGSRISTVKRLGILALALATTGCIQRNAPVEIPSGYPVLSVPNQQVYRPAPPVNRPPAPVYRVPGAGWPTYPTGTAGLPPPNTSPVVNEVGTSPYPRTRPSPPLRPDELRDNPYKAFDPTADQDRQVAGRDRPDPDADAAADTPERRQLRASDDYASLIGDGPANGAGAEKAPPSRAGTTPPTGGAAASGTPIIALLVPETDRRPSVRRLADGLAKSAALAASNLGEGSLELRKYDTAGDPRKAAAVAREAIADGAKLIIGPLFSGSASAVAPVARAANVSVISFTTDRTVLGNGLYSIGFLPETDLNRIIGYAARNDLRKIALMVPDSPFGGVIADNGRKAAQRAGAEIVQIQPFKEDFRALDSAATDFAKFYESAPQVDAVLMATNGKTLQGLAAYLAYRDVLPTKVKYLGLGLWDDKETFREATLRGGWFPGVDPARKTDFAYRYGQAYGGDPDAIAFLGYDAMVVADTLAKRGGFSQQGLLSPSGFSGMSGDFRFRRDGTNERALSILSVGTGTFTVVDPAPSIGAQVSSLAGG